MKTENDTFLADLAEKYAALKTTTWEAVYRNYWNAEGGFPTSEATEAKISHYQNSDQMTIGSLAVNFADYIPELSKYEFYYEIVNKGQSDEYRMLVWFNDNTEINAFYSNGVLETLRVQDYKTCYYVINFTSTVND